MVSLDAGRPRSVSIPTQSAQQTRSRLITTTSKRMTMNAYSGAAGNQTMLASAFAATRMTVGQRAGAEARARSVPIRLTQPQVPTSPIRTPCPPTMTMSSLKIGASPQGASSNLEGSSR